MPLPPSSVRPVPPCPDRRPVAVRVAAGTVARIVVLLLACAAPAVHAQSSILSSGPDPLAGTTVERAEALEALDASWLHAATEELAKARDAAGEELVEFDAASHLQRSRERFLREAGDTLFELLGDDGALTHAEIGEDVPRIRERHLNRFRDIAEARAKGYRPPPVADEYEAGWRFAADMAIYTVGVRNEPLSWARLALAMLVGLVVGWIAKRALGWLGDASVGGMRATLESATDTVRVPLYLAASLAGLRVGLAQIWLPRGVERAVRDGIEIAIVVLALWALWKLCTVFATSLARVVEHATEAEVGVTGTLVIKRILHVLVLVGALLVATRIVFDASLGGLLTGLGVVGVALWFVLRSVIDNLTASFTLFSDRPFRVGDTLIHDGAWVSVEDVGFRSTRLRSFDGHLFTVPNSVMAEHAIRNVSARPSIRHRFRVGIEYSTAPDKLDEAIGIVESIFESMDDEIDLDAGAHVVFERYGDYDLKLLIQYYTFTDDYWSGYEVNSAFNRTLLARFDEAGVEFAFPTQTTVLEAERGALPGLGQALRDGAFAPEDGSPDDAGGRDGRGGGRPDGERVAGGRGGRHDGGVESDGLDDTDERGGGGNEKGREAGRGA